MFETMFERATVFSAIFIFIFFGIMGIKYLNLVKAREEASQTSLDFSPESLLTTLSMDD